MKNKKTILKQWTEITKDLNNNLQSLKQLDAERDELLKKIYDLPNEELMEKMAESKKKYEEILSEVKKLKTQSEILKKQLDEK